ncbi:beta-N-acetylhexosaminidase [Ferruginibacter sp.]
MKKYFLILCLLVSAKCFSQLNIVPMPADLKMGKGSFTINKNTKIIASGLPEKFGTLLHDFIFNNYALKLEKITYSKKNIINSIRFVHDGKMYGAGIGSYAIKIADNGILIGAGTPQGFFYGLQTLFQFMPESKNNLTISQLYISDYPRFKYRGMHLDVARHFYPVAFIKKYIDYLAAYKFNTFHWHLTDDQGWRIEIKKYPLLTQVGGFRNGTITGRYPGKSNDSIRYGGFYTQQQIKEVVQYAAERYIDVIPEIEMPGHASAAIAAYPQLSCFPEEDTKVLPGTPWAGSRKGKQVQQTWGVFEDVFAPTDYTFNFLENVLDEVMPLFPSKYIHIGGDECPKESWKRSPFCQQLIAANNLKDEHGLQSYFIQRIEKYINSKSKKIIGWDEILEGGLAPNAAVMSWRGEEGGIEAAKQNHDVVMTPGSHCYLDHSQSKNEDSVTIGGYLPLEKVYSYEPVPAVLNAEQAKYILGAQGNLWTEYIKNNSKVEYMIFPRMMALSEVLWSPKEKRNWNDFEKRLPGIFERLDREKTNYSKAYYDLQATVIPGANYDGVFWKLESKNTKDKIVYLLGDEDSRLNIYSEPIRLLLTNYECTAWIQSSDSKKIGNQLKQKFSFNKATGKKITIANDPSVSYPGDGVFTLVNGVQNEKGLSKGNEFLGFLGKDLDATIDLGAVMDIKKVTLHTLEQNGSWIYLPSKVEVTYMYSIDTGKNALLGPPDKMLSVDIAQGKNISKIEIPGQQRCRYIRVMAKNFGIIPSGNPGAGNAAWLFADEIEVE